VSRGSTEPTTRFRPDIQALRAVAVLLVVVFHLRPSWLPGGYVGVDVFFVISGYLITGHLLGELGRTGAIRIRSFYARRIRRLLPASLTVLAFAVVACVVMLPESVREQNLREIIASVLYVQNWLLASDSVDYLRATAEPSLVQHFWTLSAEEQFYILWPVLLVGVAWACRGRSAATRSTAILVSLGVILVGSLVFSALFTAASPAAAYFVSPARFWEFALGGLLAAASGPVTRWFARSEVLRAVTAWLGLALIVVAALTLDAASPYPGLLALIPTIGTVLVIAARTEGRRWWSPAAIGGLRPVQFVGDISYSIYLWHWPLIVLYPVIFRHPPGGKGALAILVATLLVAAASRRFIEQPFIGGAGPRTAVRGRRAFVYVAGLMVVVLLTSVLQGTAIARERDAEAERIAALEAGPCFGAHALAPGHDCDSTPPLAGDVDTAFAATDYGDATIDSCGRGRVVAAIGDSAECGFGDAESDFVVVLTGDSHAGHWLPALQNIAAQRDWRLVTLLRSSCPYGGPTPVLDGKREDACTDWNRAAAKRILALSPDLLIVSNSVPFGYEFAGGTLGSEASAESAYGVALDALVASRISTLVIRDVPYMEDDIPGCIAALPRSESTQACDRPRSEYLDAHPDPLWIAAQGRPEVARVDMSDSFCPGGSCEAVIGGVVVYRDRQHVTATYARSLSIALAEAIDASGVPAGG
jgi:peptidoglycan/LPS O-acetylase OafA/YrhL